MRHDFIIELVISTIFTILSCGFAFWLFFFENPLKKWRDNVLKGREDRKLSKGEQNRLLATAIVKSPSRAQEYYFIVLLGNIMGFGGMIAGGIVFMIGIMVGFYPPRNVIIDQAFVWGLKAGGAIIGTIALKLFADTINFFGSVSAHINAVRGELSESDAAEVPYTAAQKRDPPSSPLI